MFSRSAAKPSDGAPELVDRALCNHFFAPAMGWLTANAAGLSAASSVLGLGMSAASMAQKPKIAKPAAVVPLPDAEGGAARLRLLQTQEEMRKRGGYGSTLVSGQMGDSRAPAVAAPLVFGKAA